MKTVKRILWFISIAIPFFVFFSIYQHLTLPINQGEFTEDFSYLTVIAILIVVNLVVLILLRIFDKPINTSRKSAWFFSLILGSPLTVIFWILFVFTYFHTFLMRIEIKKTEYLRDDCFMKTKNLFVAKNRYHFSNGYCPTATQDSIIQTVIWRNGSVKSCGLILSDAYYTIDPVEIDFLSKEEKAEVLSY